MIDARKITTEPNPYLREMYACGFEWYRVCEMTRQVILIGDNKMKTIPRDTFNDVVSDLKIIRGILPDGNIHSWISEADGSAQKFRNLILE